MNKIKPTTTRELKTIIKERIEIEGNECNLNDIDVSSIKSMVGLFAHSKFNGNISEWDVSHVTTMKELFYDSEFNGDISQWDVSRVKNMESIFYISEFNGDISK